MKLKLNPLTPASPASTHGGQACLLLVDDEPAVLGAMDNLLRDSFSVRTASGGAEALRLIAACPQPIDLIITDQRMPGMSGLEFLSQAAPLLPLALRIVVTGYTDLSDIIRFINEGSIYKYVTKPFDPIAFQILVQRAMETAALQRRNRELIAELQSANAQLHQKLQTQEQDHARKLHIDAMKLALLIWELATGGSKADLAEATQLWSTYLDDKGTLRAKTLDRYLDLASLPQKPKTHLVINTLQFALTHCQPKEQLRQMAELQLQELQQLLLQG